MQALPSDSHLRRHRDPRDPRQPHKDPGGRWRTVVTLRQSHGSRLPLGTSQPHQPFVGPRQNSEGRKGRPTARLQSVFSACRGCNKLGLARVAKVAIVTLVTRLSRRIDLRDFVGSRLLVMPTPARFIDLTTNGHSIPRQTGVPTDWG